MKHALLALAVCFMMFIATPGRAAVSVILECTSLTPIPGQHLLEEIDYDASTVRTHSVDDDGAPFLLDGRATADTTDPAQISDNEIKWSLQEWSDGEGSGYTRYSLGRYSGTLTQYFYDSRWNNGKGGGSTLTAKCQPYAPNLQKKF
jgi:hypothetical protein